MRTFKQGVHPPQKKNLSKDMKIRRVPPSPRVILPLSQHTGAPCKPLVSKGDMVKKGQLIGDSNAFISSPVHSSVTGKVSSIERLPHPVLGEGEAVVIETDEEDKTWLEDTQQSRDQDIDLSSLSPEDIRKRVREAGIVGLGGAAFPTHVKLTPPPGKIIDTVILNGCECEPYLTSDYRIMLERSDDCLFGLKIIMKAAGAKKGYIGIESNKRKAISLLRKITQKEEDIQVIPLKTKYPQGGEKMLIKAILNREVPSGGLPLDVGVVVSNVGTAVAILEAIRFKKPLIERVITVTGKVGNPSNLLVPIGTPISYCIEQCGGLKEEASRIIMGGPMMGISQWTLDVPVVKGTSGILVLGKQDSISLKEEPCIKCSRCVDHCPMGLFPTILVKLVKGERWEMLGDYSIMDCIECGCCSYVCPSKIPLVQYIKLGKAEFKERYMKK